MGREIFFVSSDTSQGRRVFWGRVATGSVQPDDTVHAAQRPDRQGGPGAEPRPRAQARAAPATAPASCWTARSMCRAATGCWRSNPRQPADDDTDPAPPTPPAARSRPPWPGWTTSHWWPAASTGRCMATAGSRPRSSASFTSLDINTLAEHDADQIDAQCHRPHRAALQEPIAALPYLPSRACWVR
jgi:sulfate adenylyltransferase subunit 1